MNMEKLLVEMEKRQVSVGELSEKTGIDRCALYRRIKTGGEKMTVSEARRIAEALMLPTADAVSIFLETKSHNCDKAEQGA